MRKIIVLVALTVTALLSLTGAAVAGGPTSVLISDPSSGRVTALYYDAPAYAELEQLLAEGASVPAPKGQLGARSFTVTWLIHDVMPWRIQYVHVDAAGGPLVATQMLLPEGGLSDLVTWTRPSQGKAASSLLQQVLDEHAAAVPSEQVPSPPVGDRVVTDPRTEWFTLQGWRWAGPGLLAGLVLGAVGARRSRAAGPRWVLDDKPSAPAPDAVATGFPG